MSTASTPKTKKKLIEVALPLEAINKAAAREKSIRHGHPSTLHLWWARRPLAACRAVLFASLVDDPSSDPTLSEVEADRKRDELFALIEELVQWENSNNPDVLARARAEIMASTGGNPPPVLDPFCGGGSIPLEAQRLGLEAHGSDLNPVAVLITKALIEIPPKFAGRKPIHPDARRVLNDWHGAQGLAADVRAYGAWMRDEAQRRIGHLYPKATLSPELGGGEATIIAWLWARTVTCPNPACGAEMPLVRSFALSTKKGKETWVEPIIEPGAKRVRFEIGHGRGSPPAPPKLGRGAKFRCLVCSDVAPEAHIKAEGMAGRLNAQLLAVVAEGAGGRIYLPPTPEHEAVAAVLRPEWAPEQPLAIDPRNIWCVNYGLTTFADLFTPRQLVALTTFSDLVGEARQRVLADARLAGLPDDDRLLAEGGSGAQAYADAVATYLALALDRLAMTGNSLVRWNSVGQKAQHAFGRQALPMVWDFAEPNFLAGATGSISSAIELAADPLALLPTGLGRVSQMDAAELSNGRSIIVATDPPYYDNVGYADLSDFFYVWLRRTLRDIFPGILSTLLTPKANELIASPYRHDGDRQASEDFFEAGLRKSFRTIRAIQHADYPFTIFYAFKQAETRNAGESQPTLVFNQASSTGWETMLEGLVDSGFSVVATWPFSTEMGSRMNSQASNALASSIVLACRPRPEAAPTATRNDFVRALRRELPDALRHLQHGNIAPVDLAQAAIGPGMAIYTRYREVREPSGDRLTVRTALALINQVLDEILTEQEGDYEPATRMAIAWFETHGMSEAPYGDAETLATAKGTSVASLVEAGILRAARGRVALLARADLPADWDPALDKRLTVWEITQHLIRALDASGQVEAARLLHAVGPLADAARDLAYRLYTVCERKGWSTEAQAYNSLVVAWPEISRLADKHVPVSETQGPLL